jgi:NAD(P)-dependent dehydrogenase (short-subunit alcohol dehydrogenase family)
MDTNITAAFIVGREAAKRMIARGKGGKIINIGSLTSQAARPTIAPYTVAKGGIKMLSRAMAAEWAQFNIQANSIGPGYIMTDMNKPPFMRNKMPLQIVQNVVYHAMVVQFILHIIHALFAAAFY